jgi:hypothetical protein
LAKSSRANLRGLKKVATEFLPGQFQIQTGLDNGVIRGAMVYANPPEEMFRWLWKHRNYSKDFARRFPEVERNYLQAELE